jgi:membrane protease YdiL (CAAX protease family)
MVPGLGQLCAGRTAEGASLMALGAAELTTGVAVALKHDVTYPGAAIPLLAFSDLLLYQAFSQVLERQRALQLSLVPPEALGDLVRAPFDPGVLSRPEVWAGIAGSVAAGVLVSAVLEGWTWQPDRRVRLFGTDYRPVVGYPIAGAIGIATFAHVAIAEETTFRGYFQSGFARRYGDDLGWVYGSLLFGAMHAPNALFIDDSTQRLRYLAFGVPFITLLGSYLGLSYRWNGYSLAAPVAIHFWYDLLVSAAGFVADPQHNALSGSIAIPF